MLLLALTTWGISTSSSKIPVPLYTTVQIDQVQCMGCGECIIYDVNHYLEFNSAGNVSFFGWDEISIYILTDPMDEILYMMVAEYCPVSAFVFS